MVTTAAISFDREAWAKRYADSHFRTDPGTQRILLLPQNSPEREIRLLEVNDLLAVREADPIDPIDFGVDSAGELSHRLLVVDVTPAQWKEIQAGKIPIPEGWSLEDCIEMERAGA